MSLTGDKGCTESTHDSGNIRAGRFHTGNFFKASKNCVIVEGSTLNYDIFSEILCIRELDNLKKCIFDDRVGKSCRNVGDRRAFLLGLLYFGIHKYRTSGSKINWILGKKRLFREILNGVV